MNTKGRKMLSFSAPLAHLFIGPDTPKICLKETSVSSQKKRHYYIIFDFECWSSANLSLR